MSSTPLPPAVRTPYFPYIDGMRALAVLAVLIYHLHGPWLPGGFVGVDVFFVISGFVVSASIVSFRGRGLLQFFSYFYARRIKRIFPALIVCLLVTAYVTALFVPVSWLSAVNQKTGLYAFFGLSNFILAQTGRDYFAPTTEFNPYTHTWSLAVEEQFYLVFPLMFLAWLSGRKGRGLSIGLFVVAGVASLIFAGWQSTASPTEAYFLTPSRFWELAAGVLLFQLTQQKPVIETVSPGPWRGILGALSLLLLLGGLAFTSPTHFPFPGALPAVVGTLGVIYFLHRHPHLKRLHKLLGNGPLVYIGRISYSLYLWHWPVFVLFRWTVGIDTPLLRFLATVLAFALAIASYTWIENPIRHSRSLRRLSQVAVITVGLACIGASWWGADKIASHVHQISLSTVSKNQDEWYPHGSWMSTENPGCLAEPEYTNVGGGLMMIYKPYHCVTPRPISEHSIYVIGDSHALAYEGLFKQYAMRNSTQVFAYNNGGCPFISLQPFRENDNAQCQQYAKASLEDLHNRIKPGDVLFLPSLRLARLSDQWALFGDEGAAAQMFGPGADAGRERAVKDAVAILKVFSDKGVQIVFEGPKPLFRAPPFRCADWFNHNNPICAPGFSVSKALLESYRKPVLQSFAAIMQQVPNVSVWDPFPILCPGQECSAFRDGKPLFLDGDHLSGNGNVLLLKDFTEFMAKRLTPLGESPAITSGAPPKDRSL
ncbi:acyltransferase family protein [Pseudomonas sp. CCI1.2]|uniref:acyltransferase family protein n=1 Tax=Pseudomonas sp. CCI1.2 TaxID=3048614 RepID=UPI002B22AAEE|nr:acyltransferase family protein [Pseudomonas sp. CCI1.2]MEB0120495.1 acyltransferase family protein [Pseudomonas sp. CCI1.2]